MKIAVYVEGQTELIFVREFLQKWYNYDGNRLGFDCYNLRDTDPPGHPTEHPYGSDQAETYYEIVNVGNDVRVLSKALKNAPNYINKGFERVVALRDMYCDAYHEECMHKAIDPAVNERFIQGAAESIAGKNMQGFVHCHFAIMEVEAWFLGMGWYLGKVNPVLTAKYLMDNLNFDLSQDPETTEYHPARKLNDIYHHIGEKYDKSKEQVNSIMSKLGREDFEMLLEFESLWGEKRCGSFRKFVDSLIPQA